MTAPIVLQVDGQEVQVIPSAMHEYVMTTEQVALGYGTTAENIRQHKARRWGELLEGKHWTTVTNSHGGAPSTYWTKRGVIRLGFFIRTGRARRFRDMAEDLVLERLETPVSQPDFSALERLAGITTQAITVQVEQAKQEIRAEVDARFSDLPIQGVQVGEVYRRGQRLGELMGGSRRDRALAWRRFNDRFQLASYRDLPARQYGAALAFLEDQIRSYDAPAPLKFG